MSIFVCTCIYVKYALKDMCQQMNEYDEIILTRNSNAEAKKKLGDIIKFHAGVTRWR